MAVKRDYYEVLGVSRSVTKEELKKQYRRMARQYHPDVNGEADAAERFKEISEAYEILADDDKRAAYDRFGHAGVGNGTGFSGFEQGFGGFADIFEEFFGSFSGTGNNRRRRQGPRRGPDLRYDLTITFEESIFGAEREIEYRRPEICSHCNGSGAQPGTRPINCTTCNGSGEVRRVQQSILGQFVNVATCHTCGGTGELIPHLCEECYGHKLVEKNVTKKVKVPPGVDSDTQIRLTGEGGAGINGGPPGNLFVVLTVAPHDYFERRGDDIVLDLQVNVSQAALGDEVTVPTVDGSETLHVPPGTQSGKVIRLRGLGVPKLDRTGRGVNVGRGDQLVIITVAIPRNLTDEQQQLFKELSRSLGKEVIPQKDKSLLGQLKNALGDLFG
ncbi:MAG: molecular chaperone DnaJ [Chloroflexota bacterium]|jgi:molecular chaperone DnaJ